ncbi:hypothetical protein GIB67_005677 [Kingdonia uniflora]|uniref:RING-type E3 ubiquitin transferase n=1 Tax=Kingdonia uniflora TaxID=39325 RepID=A0A7J7NHS8_9MAGN|nr:hypothetical protein GIB67_005677 [Kingdonia uniflora]
MAGQRCRNSYPRWDNWEEENPASWGAATPRNQPRTPSVRPYEAPTLSSDWSKTHGSNYSEPGTPQLSSPAYANASSSYVSSTPGIQPITPGSACYLPGTPGVQPMTPGGVMPPVIATRVVVAYQCETKLLGQMLYYVLTTGSGQQTLGEEYCYITQEYELRCNYTRRK